MIFPPPRRISVGGPITGRLQIEAMVVRVEQDPNTNTDRLTLMFREPFVVDGEPSRRRKEGDTVNLVLNFARGSAIDVE